jgi:hypothetical protein
MKDKQIKCIKGESCIYCNTSYCVFVDEVKKLEKQYELLQQQYNAVVMQNKDLQAELNALRKLK